MKFVQDVELAFKQLCLTKRVNFICNSDEVGSIKVKYGSEYCIEYLGTKLKNPPMMYGHHRIIEFMRNHTPKMTFAVDDGIDSEIVVEPPSDYSVDTDMRLQWRSIKDPIKLSDIRTDEYGNTIVLLVAYTEVDNISHPDRREFEYVPDKLNNHTRVRIERIGYADVGQAISPFATAEDKEMYVRHLNNQFNKVAARATIPPPSPSPTASRASTTCWATPTCAWARRTGAWSTASRPKHSTPSSGTTPRTIPPPNPPQSQRKRQNLQNEQTGVLQNSATRPFNILIWLK